MDLGVHRYALMHQLDGFRAIDDGATKCAARLEARNDQVTFLTPEVVLEVMKNAPTIAHAAAGDNDRATFETVDGHRFFRGWRRPEYRQPCLDTLPVTIRCCAWFYVQLLLEK